MDEELNTRLRATLRDLREASYKLECQLAVSVGAATDAVEDPVQLVQEPTHCERCAHSWGMHSFSGCIAAPSGHPEK